MKLKCLSTILIIPIVFFYCWQIDSYSQAEYESEKSGSYVFREKPAIDDATSVYSQKGREYMQKNQYKEAIEAFQKVLEINPRAAEACNNIAAVYLHLHEPEKAINKTCYLTH